MLIKAGVDISRLNREIRRALRKASDLLADYNHEIIVTETYGGNHGAGSLHYANDAFDMRDPDPCISKYLTVLKERLGPDFDVVDEHDHFHIEYDPK